MPSECRQWCHFELRGAWPLHCHTSYSVVIKTLRGRPLNERLQTGTTELELTSQAPSGISLCRGAPLRRARQCTRRQCRSTSQVDIGLAAVTAPEEGAIGTVPKVHSRYGRLVESTISTATLPRPNVPTVQCRRVNTGAFNMDLPSQRMPGAGAFDIGAFADWRAHSSAMSGASSSTSMRSRQLSGVESPSTSVRSARAVQLRFVGRMPSFIRWNSSAVWNVTTRNPYSSHR